jgi:putative membrane protein
VNVVLPYCGTPPSPGELLARFNLDPALIAILIALAAVQLIATNTRRERVCATSGWLVATAAFVSPLCALSVALFSARIGQHMILLLVAAPLIALGWPRGRAERGWSMWACGIAFFVALWVWHMPAPYDATFGSSTVYWVMHVTLFGTGILLWRELLHHPPRRTAEALAVGLLTTMQMGLLGAVLTLATHPLFFRHLLTTAAWDLTPLQDQQLGGTLMWVPGIALFLWTAIRSLRRVWRVMEGRSHGASRLS